MAREPFIPSDQPPDTIAVWVIYERPSFYPHGYVMLPQYARRDGEVQHSAYCHTASTLTEARQLVPPDRVLLARDPRDDPSIAETWI